MVTLDDTFESHLRGVLVMRPDGPVFTLSPPDFEVVLKSLLAAFEEVAATETQVLVLPADLRRASSRLFRGALPRVAYLSNEELAAASVSAVSVAQARWAGAA